MVTPPPQMTHAETLLYKLRDGAVWRHRDLVLSGIPAVVIRRVEERGDIIKITDQISGISVGYALPSLAPDNSERERFAAIIDAHGQGVLCLHSALRLHELTDEVLDDYVLAVPVSKWRHTSTPGLRLTQWTDARLFEVGVEVHEIMGRMVRVTDPARTVLDCFRSRQFATDDAHNALGQLLRHQHGTVEAVLLRIYNYAVTLECMDVLPAIQRAAGRFVPNLVADRDARSAALKC